MGPPLYSSLFLFSFCFSPNYFVKLSSQSNKTESLILVDNDKFFCGMEIFLSPYLYTVLSLPVTFFEKNSL